ncbi:SET and MYND domain-containing protein 4-like [Achroia grisella]|uniref:SET and MYND domain-containing protein 4-like n=1 Tax=Achroia grisella TaxID=688607 RepID=UPI0027D32737|nr:SET and MYND domain-containing protein 4-like [Achroia grisella]
MNNIRLPEDCAKQWEILLLLLSAEEKKIDRTSDNEVDTMNYFYKNEGLRKILLQWLHQMQLSYARKMSDCDTALKCDEVSLLWRQRGNDKFRADCYEDSYKCYSKGVLYADQNKSMYPLALANRSASLLKMKKFKECLEDIEQALDCGYPKELRHKLLVRKADCHLELNQNKEARDAITAARNHAATLKLPAVHIAEFERHVKKLEEKLEINREIQSENDVLPECYHGLNPDFNAASNAIQLRRNDTVGRHVVACEATRRGDVLFSEEPYAWVALQTDPPTCETCCKMDINIVPCNACSRSVYCGMECRTQAMSFHRWECIGAQADLFNTIGIAHLALRVLLITAHNGFPLSPRTDPAPSSAGDLFRSYSSVDNVQVYKNDAHPFYRMFNLVTNFDKMNNTDYIQYALTATMLTLYLEKYTKFFDYLPSRVPHALSDGQLRLLSAAIILRSLGQLVCNGHAALSLATVEEGDATGRTVSEREVRRATAIYPSAAMMNHSCDPNIINTFYNCRLIIRCSRELPAGSEVFNCYGPHKAREPTSHRRAQLRAQYMFNCTCTACCDTQRRDFVLLFTAYACQSCKGPVVFNGRRAHCQQCNADFQLDRALATIEQADELLSQAERCLSIEQRCERTQVAFRMKQQVWHKHHVSLRATADKLARLYADVGEFNKSVELIKHNIQSLEYQFGSFSVEVAHELRKLSEVMLERIIRSPQNPDYRDWCLEAHKIMKKAVQLMELNYGSWEPLVKRLKEQENLTAALLADIRAPDAAQGVHHDLHYNLKI